MLKKLSKSHRKSRFPAITWRHPENKALLLRSGTVDTGFLHALKGAGKGLAVATAGQAAAVDSEQGPDRVASHDQAHAHRASTSTSASTHTLSSQAAATESASAWERYAMAVANATPGIAITRFSAAAATAAAAASTSSTSNCASTLPPPDDWLDLVRANLQPKPHSLEELIFRSRDFALIDLLLRAQSGPSFASAAAAYSRTTTPTSATHSNAQYKVFEFPEGLGLPRSESLHSASLDSPTGTSMFDSRVMMKPTSLATGEDLEQPEIREPSSADAEVDPDAEADAGGAESGTPSPVLAHRRREESVSFEGESMLCDDERPRRSPPAGTASASTHSHRSRHDSEHADVDADEGNSTLDRATSIRDGAAADSDGDEELSESLQVGEAAFRRDAVRASSRSVLEAIGHRSRKMVSRAGRALGRASRSLHKQNSSSECPSHPPPKQSPPLGSMCTIRVVRSPLLSCPVLSSFFLPLLSISCSTALPRVTQRVKARTLGQSKRTRLPHPNYSCRPLL